MDKKTKIVCTMGPSTDTLEMVESLLRAGMNVARFNFSHGTHEEQAKRIELVRLASERTKIPVALMLDTKGPEIRLGLFKDGKVCLEEGQAFTLTTRDVEGTKEICSVNHAGLPEDVKDAKQILLSDGLVTLRIDSIDGTEIHTTVMNTGMMSNRKRVAVPGVSLSLPPVSEQDEKDLVFGCEMGVDYVAASFMQRASDVVAIRRILESKGADIRIISKIENEEGLNNLDDILEVSDGLMVARGDLGVEIPAEEVPVLQKMMIQKCNAASKPVITATQMLESMVTNPRPTRAEASDVANAILDGTDAVMLSGETAGGDYPLEAVTTMARIAKVTETSDLYVNSNHTVPLEEAKTTDAICSATVEVGRSMSISRHRPNCQIIAVTPHESALRRMQLYWGVKAIQGPSHSNSDEMVHCAMSAALGEGLIQSGDLVVVTAGVPSGLSGTTNMIRVHVTGNVLIKGRGVGKLSVTGPIHHGDSTDPMADGSILVVRDLEPEYMELAKRAGAIVTAEEGYTSTAAIAGIQFGIPVILGALDQSQLVNGQVVTVDGIRGNVYEGIANAR